MRARPARVPTAGAKSSRRTTPGRASPSACLLARVGGWAREGHAGGERFSPAIRAAHQSQQQRQGREDERGSGEAANLASTAQDGAPRGSGHAVSVARVFWAGGVKLEVHEGIQGGRADEAATLAAKQEWVIRRDVLLRNLVAVALEDGDLTEQEVQECFDIADASDSPLFRCIPVQVLEKLSVECREAGDPTDPPGAAPSTREEMLSAALGRALVSGRVVQPNEYADMQFTWTFKDQPYVARSAAWRTVVAVEASFADQAREGVSTSLADECTTSGSDCGNTAMTDAAFRITVGADGDAQIYLGVDRGPQEQSIAITAAQLTALPHLVLSYIKSKPRGEWVASEHMGLAIRRGEGVPPQGHLELLISPPGASDGRGTVIAMSDEDLEALLDLVDFVALHPHTLPGSERAGASLGREFRDARNYAGKVRRRGLRSAGQLTASLALVVAAAALFFARGSSWVRGQRARLSAAQHTLSSAFAEGYARTAAGREATQPLDWPTPASLRPENKLAAEFLRAKLRSVVLHGGGGFRGEGGKGRGSARYQVVMLKSGEIVGVSPLNGEGVSRWKTLGIAQDLRAEPRSSSKGGVRPEEAFVFTLIFGSSGQVDEVLPWDYWATIEV